MKETNKKNTKLSIYSQQTHKDFFNELLSNKDFRIFYEAEVVKSANKNFFNFKDFQVSLYSEFKGIENRLQENKVTMTTIDYYNTNKHRKDVTLNNVLIFDFETTGLNGFAVSLALLSYDIKKEKYYQDFYEIFNPQTKIEQSAIEVHKITNEEVKNKPIFGHFLPQIEKRIQWADIVVGQNVDFDLGIMIREYQGLKKYCNIADLPKFDTMKEGKDIINAKTANGKKKVPNLEEAVKFYNLEHLKDGHYHNALVDTKLTAEVFRKMLLNSN